MSTIASAEEKVKPEIKTVLFHRIDSQLFNTALNIVQYVTEIKKPDASALTSSTRQAWNRSVQDVSPPRSIPPLKALHVH